MASAWVQTYWQWVMLQIKDLKHKQEIMAQEFAEMLKETLDKMAECLENTDDKRYNIQELPTGE